MPENTKLIASKMGCSAIIRDNIIVIVSFSPVKPGVISGTSCSANTTYTTLNTTTISSTTLRIELANSNASTFLARLLVTSFSVKSGMKVADSAPTTITLKMRSGRRNAATKASNTSPAPKAVVSARSRNNPTTREPRDDTPSSTAADTTLPLVEYFRILVMFYHRAHE